MGTKKPIYLLLLGVEGSGHHMILAFLNHFFKTQKAIRNGEWYPYLFNRWDAQKKEQKSTPLALNSQRELIPEITRIISNYHPQVEFIYSSASFPYGHDRDTLRRPDIIDIVEILGPHVDLRPLVIHRDPVSCTYSALRRGFTDNTLQQARFVEDNLIFIKQQLEASGLEYQVLGYEDFVSNPKAYETGFKKWWGLTDKSFESGITKIRSSTSKNQIPTEILNQLEEFFSPMRRKQWNDFLGNNNILDLN